MSRLAIRTFPDQVLQRASEKLESAPDAKTCQFIDHLIHFMYEQPGGIGIAAPQVGVSKQIAIVDVSAKMPGSKLMIMINPVILAMDQVKISREGCMSLPHFTANVGRAQEILVGWRDIHFEYQEMQTSGIEAICIQHEVDHLNGKVFLDRVANLKTDVFRRKKYR